MKFLLSMALVSACFISNASADASNTFEIANTALNTILARTNNLTNAIKAWDGTNLLAALNDIHGPSVATNEYIYNVTKQLQEHPGVFNQIQAFKIGTPAQRLAYAVNASIANLVRRKHNFDASHVTTSVVMDLTDLMIASRNFSNVLTKLVPKELQRVAGNMISQNLDSLQQGINCFNGTASACSPAIVNPNRTYDLAVRYHAMKPDGDSYSETVPWEAASNRHEKVVQVLFDTGKVDPDSRDNDGDNGNRPNLSIESTSTYSASSRSFTAA
ncbi:hypothetical protein DV736_g3597, partial [Chaetothyriales sp. CBS 134916]